MEHTEKLLERTGHFTSSQIYRLAACGKTAGSIGAPFHTYVKEKKREIALGRYINNESSSKPTDWGNMCEPIVHDLLGLEYQLVNKTRYTHLELPWSGMPDEIIGKKKVSDIKSPWTLTSFMDAYETKDDIEAFKKAKKEWYWQLISNAILTNIDDCELILFMPKLKRIPDIKLEAMQNGYFFHNMADSALPWTSNESKIPEITKIKFTASQEDKEFLTERIKLAAEELKK